MFSSDQSCSAVIKICQSFLTLQSVTNKGSNTISNTNNLSTITDMLINCTKSVYLTITCYCNTTHELFQFYRDTTPGMAIAMSKINEDNFSYITGITEILSKRY